MKKRVGWVYTGTALTCVAVWAVVMALKRRLAIDISRSPPLATMHQNPRMLEAQGCSTGNCQPVLLPLGKHTESQPDAKLALSTRECGSPAKEGYARLVYSHLPSSSCISKSMTLLWYQGNREKGGQLIPQIEQGALYDGLPVSWGHTNKKKSVQECAEQCSRYTPGLEPLWTGLPCNAFAFCPEEAGCWSPEQPRPDVSSKGACWLMFTEGPSNPEVILRGDMEPKPHQADQRGAPGPPSRCTWQTGVLLPEGVALRNGSWSPKKWW